MSDQDKNGSGPPSLDRDKQQLDFIQIGIPLLNEALMTAVKKFREEHGVDCDPFFGVVTMQAFIGQWITEKVADADGRLAIFEDLVTGFAAQLEIATFKDENKVEH